MINQIKARYIELLKQNIGTWLRGQSAEDVAQAMFNAIKKGGNADWLKYNENLKAACREHGIKKSSELRQLVKDYQGGTL